MQACIPEGPPITQNWHSDLFSHWDKWQVWIHPGLHKCAVFRMYFCLMLPLYFLNTIAGICRVYSPKCMAVVF